MAAWNQPVGGASPINQASDDASEPSLTAIGGVPYVAWSESDGANLEVRVSRLNAAGTAWEQVVGGASPINQASDEDAFEPSLTAVGGVPHVAWREFDGVNHEIRVSRLNAAGTAWEQVGTSSINQASPINQANNASAFGPSLTSIGGAPYVAWQESDGVNTEIRVSRPNSEGTAWEQPVGGASPINAVDDQNATQPSLTAVDGVPYVAWSETDGINFELRVSRLNSPGGTWEEVVGGGSPINEANNRSALEPSLTSIGGVPYVAWQETDGTNFELRVSRLNAAGTAWEQPVGGASPINQANNASAFEPSLTSIGGVPYVAWHESDGVNNEVRVSRLNAAGTAWEQVVGGASPINQANNQSATEASLTSIGGVPYVAWQESDGVNTEIRVSRLEPEFTGQVAVPSQGGATLVAGVRTYRIPYPVGFQYGIALENVTMAETTAAGAENVLVTRQVDGLSAETSYQFRPFATAGVPAPRVLGATGSFTTLAGPAPPPTPPTDTDTAGPDTAGPDLELGGKRKQELSKKVKLTATCTDEPCELNARGKLALPSGKSRNALKALKLRPAAAEVEAGEPAKLNLRLAKRTLKVANRALDGDDKARATLRITAADALGNETTRTRKVTLVG